MLAPRRAIEAEITGTGLTQLVAVEVYGPDAPMLQFVEQDPPERRLARCRQSRDQHQHARCQEARLFSGVTIRDVL
jgi:hypothetical protein